MAEALELGDESSGLAFGVAFAEVVAAEVAVELAGGEHVPEAQMIECLTAPSARPWPIRGRSRWYWAWR